MSGVLANSVCQGPRHTSRATAVRRVARAMLSRGKLSHGEPCQMCCHVRDLTSGPGSLECWGLTLSSQPLCSCP